jgi:hypothetical protein
VNVSFLRLTDTKRLLNRRVVLPIPFGAVQPLV